VSGAPPDSVWCTRGLQLKLVTFGKFQRRSAIIHRTVRCTPDSVRCSKERRLRNSPASGNRDGCFAIIHRTCPMYIGLSGVTPEQRLLRANGHLQQQLMRARARRSTCPVRHQTSRRAQKTVLQRSNPNGFGDVAGAPDCPVHHTTVSPTKRLVWWLGL
jgi:hypothetical protein